MSQQSKGEAVRAIALSYPEVKAGTVCDRTSFKARGKAFVFMGVYDDYFDVMVKLRDSLPTAEGLAKKSPACFKVGVHGWVTVTFPRDQTPPPGLLETWIDESFRLLAHKELVAMLSQTAPTKTKRIAKKKATT